MMPLFFAWPIILTRAYLQLMRDHFPDVRKMGDFNHIVDFNKMLRSAEILAFPKKICRTHKAHVKRSGKKIKRTI